jgi:hypothetical protein
LLFKELVKLSIPDYILSQKVNADVIDIVLDYIEANSSIAYDITKVYTSQNTALKEEFVNTYLENIASAFDNALYDQNIQERLTKAYNSIGLEYDPSSLPNIADVFTDEYLNVSKNFKQRKGTIPAIKFAYDTIRNSKIQGIDASFDVNDPNFKLTEGSPTDPNQPFYYQVEGSLYKEVFENAVKPIVHPVGFAYVYSKLTSLIFSEYALLKISYADREIKVKCANGAYFEDYSDKEITLIYDDSDTNSRVRTTVQFADGSYIIRDYNTTVKYYIPNGAVGGDSQFATWHMEGTTAVKQYADSCALYLKYRLVLESTITEAYNFILDSDMHDYYSVGGSHVIGEPGLYIGNFVISSQVELFNTVLIYDDNTFKARTIRTYPALIGSGISIGDSDDWIIGHDVDTNYHVGEDQYLVHNELIEDFNFEIIPSGDPMYILEIISETNSFLLV